MRSEQAIRREIEQLRELEMGAVEDMNEILDTGDGYLDIYIDKANLLQCRRMALLWVLGEDV